MLELTVYINIYDLYIYYIAMSSGMHGWCLTKLGTRIGLTKRPARRCSIIGHHTAAITSGDLEREALSIKVAVALPVLSPIPWHWLPLSSWTLYIYCMYISGSSNISNKDKVEVRVTIYGKPNTSSPPAGYPTNASMKKYDLISKTLNWSQNIGVSTLLFSMYIWTSHAKGDLANSILKLQRKLLYRAMLS